ncbi:MAG: YbjN domain-containing protein [Planctomycetota bacterium]
MRHAVTLEKIARYLDRISWTYDIIEDSGFVRTGFRGKNAVFEVIIALDDRRARVRFLLPNLFVLSDDRLNDDVLKSLLELNMKYILIKFAYDSRDGEVRAEIDAPIDGGDLAFATFKQALFTLLATADEVYPTISNLIHGSDTVRRRSASEITTVSEQAGGKKRDSSRRGFFGKSNRILPDRPDSSLIDDALDIDHKSIFDDSSHPSVNDIFHIGTDDEKPSDSDDKDEDDPEQPDDNIHNS